MRPRPRRAPGCARKPAVTPAEHAATKLFRDGPFVDQKIQHRRYGFFGERGENRLDLPYVEIARAEVGERTIRRLWPLLSSRSSSRAFYSRLQARPRPPRPGP